MAEILLDSDVIIAWLRGYDPFTETVPGLLSQGDVLAWTPLSVAEIFAGVRKGEENQVENLFIVLETLPLSDAIGRKAGYYLRAYSKSHGVELGDALVAATAYFTKMALWTLNRKHYPMRDIQFFSPPRS
ncbi:MAG: type II toxin-antitoxin system VapC family toxin [Deltaproteobacteria bacterium]|nr:type II toxin-antitoxin system VapC family toxin [Deltaproteobacteria bacterium]MCZ6563663.1 type II toxin-antitoxin system VapC family toxin [Deltaproteobacteria bacterium]